MTDRNGIKTAAVISCSLFAVWLVLSAAAYVFQDSFIMLMTPYNTIEETERVLSLGAVVQFLFSIPVVFSCYLIIKEKGGVLPLALSMAASVLMPVIASAAGTVQQIFTGHIVGASQLVRLAAAGNVTSILSYLLNAACLTAVAAAAVHFYASKNNGYDIKREDIG